MRNLSDLEKQVLAALVSHPHRSEQGLVQMATVVEGNFMGPARGISVLVGSAEKQVAMSIPEKETEALRRKFLIVVTVFNVLKYLTEEGLIVILGDKQNGIGLGSQYNDGQTSFIPSPIADYIEENLTKYVLVTEELGSFVLSNYRDVQHIRHDHVVVISVVAIITSLILGVYGAYSNYTTSLELNRHVEKLVNNENDNTGNIVSAIGFLKIDSADCMSSINSGVRVIDNISRQLEKLNDLIIDRPGKRTGDN